MTKRERLHIKNGTKSATPSKNPGYTAPKVPKALKTLQVAILGKGWVDITVPTTDKVISGVKRRQGFQYRTV